MDDTLKSYSSDEYLGKILVSTGRLTPDQLAEMLKVQDASRAQGTVEVPRLGELLVKKGLIASEEVLHTLFVAGGLTEKAGGAYRTSDTLSLPPLHPPPPTEVAEASSDPKRVFGKYVLVKQLGVGGFAVVYKAWDTMLRQYVALKFLRTQEEATEGSAATTDKEIHDFIREARMCAKLRHPNFVRIYEVNNIADRYYLSMEYIDGPTFYELIHGTRERSPDTHFSSDPMKFLHLLRDVSRAMHHAHQQIPPLVHRDLKPQNILLDTSGHAFIADFGLAKEVHAGRQETVSGVVKGTPWYMAPEQAEGKSSEIDARTDVYALGVILYEMITGRPPFVGQGLLETLGAIKHKEPERPNAAILRALQENPGGSHRPRPVPKALETICLRAIEKKKYHRYPTAEEFATDLDRYLNSQTIIAQEPSLRRRVARRMRARPVLAGVMAAVLLAAVAAAIVFFAVPRANPAADLLARAQQHLAGKNWPGFRTAVADLREISPDHPQLDRLEKALREHDAEHKSLKQQWDSAVSALDGGPDTLKGAEDAYRALLAFCGEFKEAAQGQRDVQAALMRLQDAAHARAQELIGDGSPRDAWVEERNKSAARKLSGDIGAFPGLENHALFPVKAKPELAQDLKDMGRLIAYLGKWDLRVNVMPYAEVVLTAGGKELARGWTPFWRPALSVPPEECRIELYRPRQQERHVRDLGRVQHRALVEILGDMRTGEIQTSIQAGK